MIFSLRDIIFMYGHRYYYNALKFVQVSNYFKNARF